MPSAAMKLREIPHGHVPYASEADIIVFKFWACGMHQSRAKKRIDAQDAENLTAGLTANSPLVLTDT